VNGVFRALSDPTRRQVLQLLREGPKSAGELADHFPVSKPTMSAHFAVLREAGLVQGDKHGKAVIYRLKMSVLEEALLEFSQLVGLNIAPAQSVPAATPALKRGT
jgi:DNA-binding transcriptional ArsR family regulator